MIRYDLSPYRQAFVLKYFQGIRLSCLVFCNPIFITAFSGVISAGISCAVKLLFPFLHLRELMRTQSAISAFSSVKTVVLDDPVFREAYIQLKNIK